MGILTFLHHLNLLSTIDIPIQAIHGFRETERLQWGDVSESIIRRVREVAFPKDSSLLGPVHVLDLDKAGYIKPHVDSVKVCSSFTVLCVVCTVLLFFMSSFFFSLLSSVEAPFQD